MKALLDTEHLMLAVGANGHHGFLSGIQHQVSSILGLE
jgi:hypothetical protein